jgi:HEAT repeat protein
MRKIIVLLDVDDTSAVSNNLYGDYKGGYRYNESLFQALKANNLTEVYLFTTYSLRDTATSLKLESAGTPSRLKLIDHLKQQGITVLGVLTRLDCEYQQGPGAYYEKVIKPYEALVLQGEDVRQEKHKKEYEALCFSEQQLVKIATEHNTNTKASLYRYMVSFLENTFFHSDYAFIIVDDRESVLKEVRDCGVTEIPLLTILAKPQLTMQHYQKEMNDFLVKMRQPVVQQLEPFPIPAVEQNIQKDLFNNIDLDSEKLYEEILRLAEPKAAEGTQARVQGLGQPFYISLENAREILSQNEKGFEEKTNEYGNSPVREVGNVYYKGKPPRFLTEQAVYQMSLLLGGGVLTPTRLLMIEMPGQERRTVQASLAVQGENLEHILHLPGGIKYLSEEWGVERLQQEFPVLLKGSYITDWLSKTKYELTMPFEEQVELLVDKIFDLPRMEWPLEFRNTELTREQLKLKIVALGIGKAPILGALALSARYPGLISKMKLTDFLCIPDLFKVLPKLYPKHTPQQMLEELPKLFRHFVPENISKHFLLALFTEPQDHKGDNFIVKILHDANGQLKSLEIVGIDNDMTGIGNDNNFGMEGAIRACRSSDGNVKYFTNIKTLFYGVQEFLAMRFSTSIRQSSQSMVVDWLGKMLEHLQHYLPLFMKKAYQSDSLDTELCETHGLDKQVLVNFADRLAARITKVQKLIKDNSEITNQALLLEMEPILGRYCEELSKDYSDPQSFVRARYDSNRDTIGKVLRERLQEKVHDGKTIEEHLSQIVHLKPEFCTYEEAFKQFVLKHKLFQEPFLQESILHFVMSCQEQTWLLQEPMTLTFETFGRFYQRYKQAALDLLKGAPKLDFVFGANRKVISLKDPDLLYRAMQSVVGKEIIAEPLVRGLLSLGAVTNKRTPDGSTLLHYAAVYCPAAIQLLVEAGLEYSVKNTDGKTPLDFAMERSNLPSVQALLSLGAGRYATLANGLNFIQHHQNNVALSSNLLSQHFELAWELALQKVSQEKGCAESVRLEGLGLGSRRYLKPELCRQVFKEGNIAKGLKKENLYGRHNVTSMSVKITQNLSIGLHLKENPELFGRETKVHYLAKHLFGFITPPIALWRFSKLEGWWGKVPVQYPILASRTISGSNLKEVLEHYPEQLYNLDHESVSEAIILALLINPEDGRGDNYILQPFTINNKTKYRIVSIDNDQAFVRPIKIDKEGQEVEGPDGLQVKTILYCLNEMQMPLHPRVRERLLKINPDELLDAWLQDLENAQNKINALFEEEDKKVLKEKKIFLDVEFKPSIVLDIYEKLVRIQALLRKRPESSGLTLLRHTIPNLSLRYIDAFQQYPTVMERFNFLTKECFETQVMQRNIYSDINIYLWPKSKISLEQTPNIEGNAIMFVREDIDAFAPLSAYFIRHGQWVSTLEQKPVTMSAPVTLITPSVPNLEAIPKNFSIPNNSVKPVLKSVAVDLRILATFAVNEDGLLQKNKKNKEEVEALVEQVMTRMKFDNKHVLSKTKSSDILEMTKPRLVKELKIEDEKAETLQTVRKSLEEMRKNLNELKVFRDKLQAGEVQKFRGIFSADQQEWIVNGKGIEFPGIDFAAMKLPNNEPDIAKQEKVLAAIAEVEFRRLRIQGCAALTDRILGNLLKNSKGLLTLSLIDCPKLTDAALLNINKACPHLEKLELQGLNLMQPQESFPKLKLLRIKNCEKLIVWKGEVSTLNKLEVQGCPLLQNQDFYTVYPFLLPLSQYMNQNINEVNILMQTVLKEKNVHVKSFPIEVKQKILNILNDYWKGRSKVDVQAVVQNLIKKLRSSNINKRLTAAKALGALSVRLPVERVKEVTEALLAALKDEYWSVRQAAANGLGALSARLPVERVKDVSEALLEAFKDSDWRVGEAAANGLGALSARLPEELVKDVSEALLAALKDSDSDVRKAAANGLGALGARLPKGLVKGVSEALLAALKDADWRVREGAANGLGALGARLPEELIRGVSEVLLAALKDFYWRVRQSAANGLSALTTRLPEGLFKRVSEALLAALNDRDWYVEAVEAAAANGLGALGAQLPEGVKGVSEGLLEALKGWNSHLRKAAANGLGALGARLPEELVKGVTEALLAALKDWNSDVRKAAANGLGALGARLPEELVKGVTEVLLAALKDDDWSMRQAATKALEALSARLPVERVNELTEALLAALKDWNTDVRQAAAKALEALSARLPVERVKEVTEALLVALKDEDSWLVREAAAKALEALSARLPEERAKEVMAEVTEALLATLKDKDWSVRQAAANALCKLSLRLPVEDLQFLVNLLLNAFDSFLFNYDVYGLTKILVYLMDSEYFNTVVGGAVRKSLSTVNVISLATPNSNSLENTKHDAEKDSKDNRDEKESLSIKSGIPSRPSNSSTYLSTSAAITPFFSAAVSSSENKRDFDISDSKQDSKHHERPLIFSNNQGSMGNAANSNGNNLPNTPAPLESSPASSSSSSSTINHWAGKGNPN